MSGGYAKGQMGAWKSRTHFPCGHEVKADTIYPRTVHGKVYEYCRICLYAKINARKRQKRVERRVAEQQPQHGRLVPLMSRYDDEHAA